MRLARFAGLVAAGALALAVVAPASAAGGTAMIRVLHGSPDAPAVDVFANGNKVDALSNLSFGHITDYVSVPAGTYSIKVCATADNTVCPIGPVDLTFDAGKHYTIAASDLLAQIKANVFVDAPSPVSGKTQVRVVHLSADTPAVDVLTQDKATTVVSDLAYPKATDYLTLAPGSYDLIVCANADHSVCPLDPGPLALASGKAYSVFAVGALSPAEGQQGLTAVVAVDATAAAPTPTAPPTDTLVANPASSGTDGLALLALVAVAVAAGILSVRRFAPARASGKRQR